MNLKKYAKTGLCELGNLIEVMCCEGGCLGGNATVNNQKRAKKQIDTLEHVIFANFSHKPIIELCMRLKKLLPDGLAKEINQNAELLKAMLTNLSDGVNRKFCTQMNQEEILSAIRNSKLEKYLDEYFDVSFRIRDDKNLEEMAYRNRLLDTITDKVRESRSKIDELKTFLRLDDITPETSIDDAVNIIKRELTGDGTLHRGFLENGQNRIKNLLDFLGNDSKELLFERLNIYRAKTIKTSSVTPLSMTDFIKDSVLKVAPHKTWVRRIGIAFAALCGITAIALTQIGQTNKFNPDIYHKRNNN